MQRLQNTVRDYDWGSPTAIPELLGLPADGRPQAELWMGAHPGAPSLAAGTRLDDLVASDPPAVLGRNVADRFGEFPYLFKILAAARPLSLQVHPTMEQARTGFAAEQRAGVPIDAPHRRYKDPRHKPEMMLALTEFQALCGFRDPLVTADLVDSLSADARDLIAWSALLRVGDEQRALRGAVEFILNGGVDVEALARACAHRPENWAVTVVELAEAYPGDPGVAMSLLLNRLTMQPGEALFMPAGNLHAYLHGTGLEIMASSDNVLRGGLTSKYVDVPELVRVCDFRALPVPMVEPAAEGPVTWWRPPVPEFSLGRISPAAGQPVTVAAGGPRIVLCTEGSVQVRAGDGEGEVLAAGDCVLLHGDEPGAVFEGAGTVYLAGCPTA